MNYKKQKRCNPQSISWFYITRILLYSILYKSPPPCGIKQLYYLKEMFSKRIKSPKYVWKIVKRVFMFVQQGGLLRLVV